QFHDILPGGSIAWVHQEAEATYARVRQELEDLVATAAGAITGPGTGSSPGSAPDATWVLNAGPWPRREVVAVPASLARPVAASGQPLSDGSVATLVAVPASGAVRVGPGSAGQQEAT